MWAVAITALGYYFGRAIDPCSAASSTSKSTAWDHRRHRGRFWLYQRAGKKSAPRCDGSRQFAVRSRQAIKASAGAAALLLTAYCELPTASPD